MPEPGRKNWVFARVRNDCPDPVAHAVVVFRADPSPLLDPGGPTIPPLAIGASVQRDWPPYEERVVAVSWDNPVASSSYTLSAQVLSPGLPRSPCPESPNRNDLAWKTRTDGLAFAGSPTFGTVVLGNRFIPNSRPVLLELTRNPAGERASVVLSHPVGLPVGPTSHPPCGTGEEDKDDGLPTEFTFPMGPLVSLSLDLPPSSVYLISLVITLPDDVADGEVFRFDLVARRPDDSSIIGGMAFVLTAP